MRLEQAPRVTANKTRPRPASARPTPPMLRGFRHDARNSHAQVGFSRSAERGVVHWEVLAPDAHLTVTPDGPIRDIVNWWVKPS